MSQAAGEAEIPDHDGPAEPLPDYSPAEAEESAETGEGEV